jgi:hypothetical protein
MPRIPGPRLETPAIVLRWRILVVWINDETNKEEVIVAENGVEMAPLPTHLQGTFYEQQRAHCGFTDGLSAEVMEKRWSSGSFEVSCTINCADGIESFGAGVDEAARRVLWKADALENILYDRIRAKRLVALGS